MRYHKLGLVVLAACAVVFLFTFFAEAGGDAKKKEAGPKIKCHLTFSFKGWAVFYEHGKGQGEITCDNGQRADVKISYHGGGVTFGKKKITKGRGTFSEVGGLSELFGSYASSEAHVGVVGSAEAKAMTKGGIGLALHGTGKGYDIGIDFGSFNISPKK